MKVTSIIVGAMVLAFSSSAAQAQNFVFEAAANPATTVGGPDFRGNPVVGAFWTGTSTVTWADGKKTTDKYTCISVTQPVNDKVFDAHTVCDGSGADGTYTSVWGCQYTSKDMMSMACFGGLTGRTGKYAGRGGTMTFMGRNGSGSGTGTWATVAN
jgi:hypothetical protein